MFDALGINLAGLITQLVSFTVLFVLLKKLLYGPIMGLMERRTNRIKDSLELAENMKAESQKSQEDMAKQLEAARSEGRQLVEQAKGVADRFREEEISKARIEIQNEKSRAESEIKREKDATIEALRQEFASLAITAAEKVVQKSLDEKTHNDVITQVLNDAPTVVTEGDPTKENNSN